MAVRFVPSGDDETSPPPEDRPNLAEVIEFRARLPRVRGGARRPDSAGEGVEAASPAAPVIGLAAAERPASRIERARAALDRAELAVESEGEADRGEAVAAPVGGAAPADALSGCREEAVRMLARKARSRGELRRELLAREHAVGDVDDVLDEFERNHYLDDLGLARSVAEGLRERKRASRSQIRLKLRERQLDDDVIETVLAELDDDEEHELLRAAAQERARRLADLDRQTAERRLLGFLARRGWSGERATRAAREALDATGVTRGGGGVRFR